MPPATPAALHTLVLASNNPHKRHELQHALQPLGVHVTTAPDGPDPDETGTTFLANATLKALAFTQHTLQPSLADDSGLVVDALDGAPGVYSARFSGPNATDQKNNTLLLERLHNTPPPQRTAHFHCCLALVTPAGPAAEALAHLAIHVLDQPDFVAIKNLPEGMYGIAMHGRAHGVILDAPRGDAGFGYDPLFLSNDLGCTFAEASLDDKRRVSHRGHAVDMLVRLLKG